MTARSMVMLLVTIFSSKLTSPSEESRNEGNIGLQ